MKEIYSVDLVLENCESIKIPVENIKGLHFTLEESDYRLVNGKNLYDSVKCKVFYIVIDNIHSLRSSSYPEKDDVLERLSYTNDVTHVKVLFEDGTSLYITVPWKGSFINLFQFSKANGSFLELSFKKEINIRNILIAIIMRLSCLTKRIL